jgi:hypothetical protein
MKPKLPETRQSETKQVGPEKRPANVGRALRIMWVIWAIGFLLAITFFVSGLIDGTIESNIAVALGFMILSPIVLLALLIRAVSSGKNWARITYGVFTSLSLLVGLAHLFSTGINDLISIIIFLFHVAVYISLIWLLFQRASTDWFRRMSGKHDTFMSSNLNLDDSDGRTPEPKKLRTFAIVVLTIYVFVFIFGNLSSYFSIEGTKDIVGAIQNTFILVLLALTLFTFVKRNRLYLVFALIMSIGGFFSTLAYRLFFVTDMALESADFENIAFFALPLLLIFLYRRKSLKKQDGDWLTVKSP